MFQRIGLFIILLNMSMIKHLFLAIKKISLTLSQNHLKWVDNFKN